MATYYLVERRTDNIVDKIDSVTPGPVKDYFIGRKQMKDNEKSFDDIWKVMEKKLKITYTTGKWVKESTNGGKMKKPI